MEMSAEFSPPGIFPLQGVNVSFLLSNFSPPGIFPLHFFPPGIFPLQEFFPSLSTFSPPFRFFASVLTFSPPGIFSPLFFPLPRFFPSFSPSLGTGGDIWWKRGWWPFWQRPMEKCRSETPVSPGHKTPQNNPNWHSSRGCIYSCNILHGILLTPLNVFLRMRHRQQLVATHALFV